MVTRNWLREVAKQGQIIPLIKEYRELNGKQEGPGDPVTGFKHYKLGLRETKEAIDNCKIDGKLSFSYLERLFDPWLPPVVKDSKGVKPLSRKQEIQRAIGVAWDKWGILGFNNPYDAIKMVIDNYEMN